MPSTTGVTRLEIAKTWPHLRCSDRGPYEYARKTNADPRSTIPMSMSESGMCSTVPNAANAGGKQTKSTTTTTISQT